MKDYKLYVFDMDGVLFRGDEPTPSGPETVKEIAAGGAVIRYLTNNSTRTRRDYAEKLFDMGYPAEPAMIIHQRPAQPSSWDKHRPTLSAKMACAESSPTLVARSSTINLQIGLSSALAGV